MEEKNNLQSRIEDFLNGKKDDTLINDIKSKIDKDDQLRQDLEEHTQAYVLLKREGEETLKKKLTQQLQDSRVLESQAKRPSNNWLKWLLVIALLGSLAALAFFIKPQLNSKQNQFAYTDPAIPNVRSIGDEIAVEAWEQIMVPYERKDYQATLLQLNKLKNNNALLDQQLDQYHLIKGVCLIRMAKYKEAESAINLIKSDSQIYDQALWYQFVSSIEQNNNSEAKRLNDLIQSHPTHYRSDKAKAIIKSLQ